MLEFDFLIEGGKMPYSINHDFSLQTTLKSLHILYIEDETAIRESKFNNCKLCKFSCKTPEFAYQCENARKLASRHVLKCLLLYRERLTGGWIAFILCCVEFNLSRKGKKKLDTDSLHAGSQCPRIIAW